MLMKALINQPSLTALDRMDTLVEFKTTFNAHACELHVFETHQNAKDVALHFDSLTLTSMIRGKKEVVLEQSNTKFAYLPGTSVLVSPQEQMLIDFPQADAEPSQCLALSLNSEYINKVTDYYNIHQPKINDDSSWYINTDLFYLSNSKSLAGAINNILRIMMDDDPFKDKLSVIALDELIIRLLHSQGQELLAQGKQTGRFAALVDFIKTHLHEKISIDQLAKFAYLSKTNFYKLFKQELGMSPNDFIIQLRLDAAKQMLLLNKSINEIAFATGFSDANYFIKMFKKSEGITPKVYQLAQLNVKKSA
jgi:AraC-like DNA-binding protein